ncbi:MAG: hypothetical protein HY079_00700 [Elusimicrobia bacterium]|nr:hypothetical protein [Elusimicrobiota bacterium]
MTWRLSRWTWPALAASFAYALAAGAEWNERLVQRPVHGQVLAGQASGDDEEDPQVRGSVFQRIRKTAAAREAEYGFINFNRDKLRVTYRIDESAFKRYNAAYGYRNEDIEELRRWRDDAVQSAYKLAVKEGKGQAAVDAAAANLQKEYERRLREYLEDRGFRLEKGNVTRIDMPLVVKKNGPQIKPLAQTFERIAAQKGYRSMDIIGTVLSFSQTAVKYRQPDDLYKGKHTGGILPPITTVVLGWGDCDTKTALVASILTNWSQMRMVGLGVPGHYLMAVLQIPDKGDMFVEYQGLQYVLLEPAGPAWLPPGRVGDESVALLNGSDGYKIYPFF